MIALTPGSLRARLTSMFKIRACEKRLRTNPPQTLSGRVISAEYRQAPVTLLGPSTLAMLRPMKVSFTSIPRFFLPEGLRGHNAPQLQSAGINLARLEVVRCCHYLITEPLTASTSRWGIPSFLFLQPHLRCSRASIFTLNLLQLRQHLRSEQLQRFPVIWPELCK